MTQTPSAATTAKTRSSDVRRQEKAIRLNLLLDLALVTPVVLVAVLANSMVLLTDVFDYAKCITIALVSYLVLRRIRKGRTEEYEYGPEKIEVVASAFVACVMLAGVVAMAAAIIMRIILPEPVVPFFGLAGVFVHVAGCALNGWLWLRNKRIATETCGPIMEATWRGHRADTFMNIGVILSLVLTLSLRDYSWSVYIDPICALIALVYPAGAFVSLLRRSLDDLTDKTLDENIQLLIMKRLAECYDGYETFHGVKTRRAGSRSFIEIRLGFHADRTVGEVMDTIEQLKTGLESDVPGSEVSIVLAQAENLFEGHKSATRIKIVPLSPATLGQALTLINTTFRLTENESPVCELEESVEPGRHTEALALKGISDPRYWVALYHGRVMGLTGIYFNAEDRDLAVWGGWTVYDQSFRSSVTRAKLLMMKKMLIEARATGRKLFRLYTSMDPAEAAANRLYDRAGLKVYKTEPMGDGTGTILYRQAETDVLLEQSTVEKSAGRKKGEE